MTVEVLIAGAGPTGLALALWLSRLGVRVRIVDKVREPGTTSRALVVQARTLELYQQIGLARTLVDSGLEFTGLSEGRAGAVHAGDRLPWVEPAPGAKDNFGPLASLRWQVHVHGAASPELARACAARDLPLHVFSFGPAAARAGMVRDALYLVRPDGYVALADPSGGRARLERYLESRGLRLEWACGAEALREESGSPGPTHPVQPDAEG